MGMLVEVDDIHVRYGDLVALRGISLKVEESEVVCIIGPNGAGKSTTLAAIAGGVTPHAGTIRVGGQSILGQSEVSSGEVLPQVGDLGCAGDDEDVG